MNFKILERVAKLQCAQEATTNIDVVLHDNGFVEIINSDPYTKIPQYDPTLAKVVNAHMQEDINTKIEIGGFGSGKSSAILSQCILRDAITMPACDDGVRRCRFLVVRNTQGELESTTLQTWRFWTAALPWPQQRKKPVYTLTYDFRDKDGLINLEVIWLALDRPTDIGKLASLETTSCFFNELKFIPKSIFDMMHDRCKRYPAKSMFTKLFNDKNPKAEGEERLKLYQRFKPYKWRIYADTNAPRSGHWIEKLDLEPIKGTKVYHQPPALIKDAGGVWVVNDDADNIVNIGSQYYLDMIPRGDEYIKVHAQGKYGTVVAGKPVYPSYNDDYHSVPDLEIIPNEVIYYGVDYGKVSPALILGQHFNNQIRIFKEFAVEDTTVKQLIKHVVRPFLNKYCKGMMIDGVGDPANTYDGMEQMHECGLEVKKARTNNVEPRTCSVENRLNENYKGQPGIIISRAGCPKLREGFIGEYHYKELKVIGEDKFEDRPYKNHPYSDLHDALQYMIMLIVDEENLQKYDNEVPRHSDLDEDTRSKITGY